MKPPPFEREERDPEFDKGLAPRRARSKQGATVLAANGDRIIFSVENDERALDRLAELLDWLFRDGVA
jgi:hypothetical protein